MLKKLLDSTKPLASTDLAMLILRIGLALLMIPHGHDKFKTLWDGGGGDFPDPLHVSPKFSLFLTVFAEFICSILLAVGLFSRFALIFLMGCMFIIAFSIHGSDPLGDKEHALLYFVGYIVIFLIGVGKYSLDNRYFKK
ncbi:MAG: DoxX family protein [Spirosomaceae bacterium]|jgi:putative oxidoreductase|nr:DoxX family protein [Spirosomataceae bacterium]